VSRINETLKQRIDEIDLDRRLNELVDGAEKAVTRVVETAGEYAHDHRDDVDRLLTRVSTAIDERTDGKYADQVVRVRSQVERGVGRLAGKRRGA
jgi:hypothetical protein